ncbi:ryanodine receptor 3 isoform X6, partial [Lates japonicus]
SERAPLQPWLKVEKERMKSSSSELMMKWWSSAWPASRRRIASSAWLLRGWATGCVTWSPRLRPSMFLQTCASVPLCWNSLCRCGPCRRCWLRVDRTVRGQRRAADTRPFCTDTPSSCGIPSALWRTQQVRPAGGRSTLPPNRDRKERRCASAMTSSSSVCPQSDTF